MTYPAFILTLLISPFTLSFYLWFILTVENTAHFLVAQIKLKPFFLLSPYSSWTHTKKKSKWGPWLDKGVYFSHLQGNQAFIPKDHIQPSSDHSLQTTVAFHLWKLASTKKGNYYFYLTVSWEECQQHLYFLSQMFCLYSWDNIGYYKYTGYTLQENKKYS